MRSRKIQPKLGAKHRRNVSEKTAENIRVPLGDDALHPVRRACKNEMRERELPAVGGRVGEVSHVQEKGLKYDDDKPRYDLICAWSEDELARVLAYGAGKYSAGNWRRVPDARERYYAALRRHLGAWRRGYRTDPESGLSHLGHAYACLMFLLSSELCDLLDDDNALD
jgi:hypothetical protein